MLKLRRYIYYLIAVITLIVTFFAVYNYFLEDFKTSTNLKQIDVTNKLEPCYDFIKFTTIYANDYLQLKSYIDDEPLFSSLIYDETTNLYSFDSLKQSKYQEISGNITGLGNIPNDIDIKKEINMAISMNEFFVQFYNRLPSIAWVYYTSDNNFINMYPWVSSKDFGYSDVLKTVPFYTIVLPKNNAERKPLWTPVYLDEFGKGLMVSLSSPIYYQDVFKGVVSLDLTTDTLGNEMDCNYKCYLIDTDNTVIAANKSVNFNDEVISFSGLTNISEEKTKIINNLPSGSVERIGTNYIYKHNFVEAPWTMVSTLSIFELILKSLLLTSPILIICALFLLTVKEIDNRKKAESKVKQLAITDELTGLKNRHFLDIVLETAFSHADRFDEKISMIMFDLDHFKIVNDTWGHPTGDQVLKQTAAIASTIIRSSDILVRWGGEEFIILTLETDNSGACELSEKLRLAFESYNHDLVGVVTASFGVVERYPKENFIDLYKRLDKSLYFAKESGRNRVVSFNDEISLPIASVHMSWNDEWNSGNDLIDQEHREILNIANQLLPISLSNNTYDTISIQIDNLLQHVFDHFKDEENLQILINYPDIVNHKKIHDDLITKAMEIKENYKKGNIKSSAIFSFILDDVIVDHLIKEDVKYFSYVEKYNNKNKI